MFIPQVIAALFASLTGAGLAGKLGWKSVYLSGLIANLASMVLLIVSRFIVHEHARGVRAAQSYPATFWVFAAFAVLYGCCETMNGNWSQIDLIELHVSATTASLTLTVFWAMVTAGRVVFTAVQRWVPSRCRRRLPAA